MNKITPILRITVSRGRTVDDYEEIKHFYLG